MEKKVLGLNIGMVIFYRANDSSLCIFFLIKIQTQKNKKKAQKPVPDTSKCKAKAKLQAKTPPIPLQLVIQQSGSPTFLLVCKYFVSTLWTVPKHFFSDNLPDNLLDKYSMSGKFHTCYCSRNCEDKGVFSSL